jgi:hypothetical protein
MALPNNFSAQRYGSRQLDALQENFEALDSRGARSVIEDGADPTGIRPSENAINAALDKSDIVYIPPGVYSVSAVNSIIMRAGKTIMGAGYNKTILYARPGGGSGGEVANYLRGSIIRRNFNPAGPNDYVNDCVLSDFSVVMNHPTNSVDLGNRQVAIDFRNITRSKIIRCHVGTIPPVNGPVPQPAFVGNHMVQGYGILLGNVSSGSSAYAGGEVNKVIDCPVWGAYKGIAIDEAAFSINSAALATVIERADIQACHHLVVQESQFGAGCSFVDNVLQDVRKQPGDSTDSYVLRCEGYNNTARGGYIEAGSGANYLLYLGTQSKNNRFSLPYYSAVTPALFLDVGNQNVVEYFDNAGTIPGGVDSAGAPVFQYNRVFSKRFADIWVKFHWNGVSAVVIDGQNGGVASVVRNGVGDYSINFSSVLPSDDYSLAVAIDANASGNAGLYAIGNHSNGTVRLYTYAQNGGVTTQLDPRFVWVKITG